MGETVSLPQLRRKEEWQNGGKPLESGEREGEREREREEGKERGEREGGVYREEIGDKA